MGCVDRLQFNQLLLHIPLSLILQQIVKAHFLHGRLFFLLVLVFFVGLHLKFLESFLTGELFLCHQTTILALFILIHLGYILFLVFPISPLHRFCGKVEAEE